MFTAYITTAKIYIMVFYCLFQDNISGFNMCFPIRCLGFYCCLYISYAPFLVMIFLIIAPHPFVFMHNIWDYLAGFQGQTCSHLCLLHCFPIFLFRIWMLTFLYIRCYRPPGLEELRTRTPTNPFLTSSQNMPCNPPRTCEVLST